MDKIIKYILILAVLILSLSLKVDELENDKYKYEATVLGKGIDCGEVFILKLKALNEDCEFPNEVYYADSLASEFKVEGLKILLNCRKPANSERYSCTCEGPGYDHIIVQECKELEN